MSSLDRFWGNILVSLIIFIVLSPVIAILFEEYKFNAMLKKISFTQSLYCYI